MGSFIAAGTPVKERVVFNSGQIDFGSNRLVDVESIKIDQKYSIARMYVLNSIKTANIARHSMGITITGKTMSFSPQMELLIYGSSSGTVPVELDILDGQATLQNPVITLYDANLNEFQYQVINAVFSNSSMTAGNEAYGSWDFTMEATDMKLLYTV